MRYVKPHYFDEFKCTADKCQDTCCAGWKIMIDDASLKKYMNIPGSFGNRMINSLDFVDGSFLQKEGRCSFLNEKNLCDIVIQMGEDYLCDTCNRYPRHIEEFEGVREMSLSISCPEAAKLVLGCKDNIVLLEKEDDEEDPLEDEFEDFDLLLFTKLQDARSIMFDILKQREVQNEEGDSQYISVWQRIRVILELAGKLQKCLDSNRIYDMDEILQVYHETYKEMLTKDVSLMGEEERFYKIKKHFHMLERLERMRDEWSKLLQEAWDVLYAKEAADYLEIRKQFLQNYGNGGKHQAEWEVFLENLMYFFIYTYFCGAVYDDWIYSKVALAAFSVCYVQEFVMFWYVMSDKNIDKQEWVSLAYRYAREVEHSDDNLNMLEEWLQDLR